jgi:transcriptional regulator with XRE-family HTH domain
VTRTPDEGAVATPTFGARLRKLRESAGLSQTALAGDDLHPSYVSLLESGRRAPTADVVAVLAARLGVAPDVLSGEISLEIEQPLALAEASLGLGRSDEAVALLEPFRSEMTTRRCTRDSLIFRATFVAATALENVGQLDEATRLLEVLRTSAESSRHRHPWLRVAVSLVRCYRDAGDLGRSIDVGEEALARCEGLATAALDGHAQLVSTLAGAYSERGDLLRASLLLDELLAQTSRGGSLADQAAAYWNAAITAAERGHALGALRLCDEAAALVSRGDDLRAVARIQVTRAWVLLAQNPPRATEAHDMLSEALPALRQHASAVFVSSAQIELARCDLLLARPEDACREATSALEDATDAHPVERARALTVLGAAYLAQDQRALGVASLEDAAGLLENAQAPRHAASVWRALSDVYRGMGDLERAMSAADRAFDAAGVLAQPVSPVASLPEQREPSRRSSRTSS